MVFDAAGVHVVDGAATFTAPNGDQLWARESAEIGPLHEDGSFDFTGTWTFTGGTGRFAGAADRVDFTGAGSIETSTTERSFQGRIAY